MSREENFNALSERNTRRAWEIVRDLDVANAWRSIGAEVHLIGSLKTGLLMKNRDIDFHVYTPDLVISDSFSAMARLAEHSAVQRIECRNLIHTDEACIEWHAWYQDWDEQLWQIDMIHILKGSAFDGFAEKAAERIAQALTPKTRQAILRLKFETPDLEKIMGIEYYMAVLRDGIATYADFETWRRNNPLNDIVLWTP